MLDLRGNPGGLLDEAVLSASLFLPEGEVVVSTESRTQGDSVHKTVGGNLPQLPAGRPDRPRHRLGGGDPRRGAGRRRRRAGGRHPLLRQGRLPAGEGARQRRRPEADGRRVLHPRRGQPGARATASTPTCKASDDPETPADEGKAAGARRAGRSGRRLSGAASRDGRAAARGEAPAAAARGAARKRAERPRRGRGAAARAARLPRLPRRARGRGGARRRRRPSATAGARRDLTALSHLHRRPGHRPRLRRRRLGPARGRRRPGLDPHRRRRRPRAARARRSTSRRAAAPTAPTSPARSSRCCRTRSAATPAAWRRGSSGWR